jgi:maltoporin
VAAQHRQKGFFGGLNTFGLQDGRGPGTAFACAGNATLDNGNPNWRAAAVRCMAVTLGGQVEYRWK